MIPSGGSNRERPTCLAADTRRRPGRHTPNRSIVHAQRPESPLPRHKVGAWFWALLLSLFIVAGLAVLPVLWIGGLAVRSQQVRLTPERLAQARALWARKRPQNYALIYTKSGGAHGTIRVEVRDSKAVAVTLDDRPITQDDRPLSPSRYGRYDMDGLFDDIEEFLDIDARQPELHALTVAQFSADDGHLLLYSRQVPRTADAPGGSVKISDVKLEVPAANR
jgi:hypothetical protein